MKICGESTSSSSSSHPPCLCQWQPRSPRTPIALRLLNPNCFHLPALQWSTHTLNRLLQLHYTQEKRGDERGGLDGVRKTEEKREMKERWMKDDRNMTEQRMNESGGGEKEMGEREERAIILGRYQEMGTAGFSIFGFGEKRQTKGKVGWMEGGEKDQCARKKNGERVEGQRGWGSSMWILIKWWNTAVIRWMLEHIHTVSTCPCLSFMFESSLSDYIFMTIHF